ncbi:response regulator transcription factor [Rhizobium daejeonense]
MNSSESEPVRVIIVEDDADLREGLTDFLRLHLFAVTAVATGRDFTLAFATETFDIAIIDVNLPDVSGFEIVQRLTKTTNMGVIMLTARTSRGDKLKGYAEGANLYLTKPVDGDELAFAVKNLSRRIKAGATGLKELPRSAGNWSLDRVGHRLVSPQGMIIKLSGREATLLSTLVAANGTIVARAELGLAVGYDSVSDTRSLDAVVQRLRVKAREAGTELPVHVIHGVGFQLSGNVIVS